MYLQPEIAGDFRGADERRTQLTCGALKRLHLERRFQIQAHLVALALRGSGGGLQDHSRDGRGARASLRNRLERRNPLPYGRQRLGWRPLAEGCLRIDEAAGIQPRDMRVLARACGVRAQ